MLINFNHLKTFYNALVHKMKSFRGNWEQNDPTADDYIKNRPFYSEGAQEVTILSYKIDTDAQSVTPMDAAGPTLYQIYFEPSVDPFSEGQEYTVIWDKETYTCVAKDLGGLVALGDPTITGMSGNSTGEPFILAINPDGGFGIIMTTKAGKYPVVVKTRQEVVHKLDKKYIDLPDNIVTDDQLADVAKTGSYNDLVDAPEVYPDVVRYNNTQDLTEVQKASARYNIGAGTSNFSGDYNDLTNKTHSRSLRSIELPYYYNMSGTVAAKSWTRFTSKLDGDNDTVRDMVNSGRVNYVKMGSAPSGIYWYRGTVTHKFIGGEDLATGPKECTGIYHVFGNGSLFSKYVTDPDITGYEDFEDTGETFCYAIAWYDVHPYDAYFTANYPCTIWINDSNQSIKLAQSVTGFYYEYETLDDKYLPDTIARVEDIPEMPTYINSNYMILVDQANGYEYIIQMANGNIVSFCKCDYIEIVTNPTKLEYVEGDAIDLAGISVLATCADGSTKEVNNYTYSPDIATVGTNEITIAYEECGAIYTSSVQIAVQSIDELLTDFTYTANSDGTYTLTGWKSTTNGESGTELIVPDNSKIIM